MSETDETTPGNRNDRFDHHINNHDFHDYGPNLADVECEPPDYAGVSAFILAIGPNTVGNPRRLRRGGCQDIDDGIEEAAN